MTNEIQVKEKFRTIAFIDGTKTTFHNIKWFDNSGNWLRIGCNEGYILLNPEKIKYIIVPEKAKVR